MPETVSNTGMHYAGWCRLGDGGSDQFTTCFIYLQLRTAVAVVLSG